MPKSTFNMKLIAITALVIAGVLVGYILFGHFMYQSGVAAEESMVNSGESPIERKQYQTGFPEEERPAERLQQQQVQQQQRSNPPQRREPPEPKPIVLGFGKAEKQEATSTPAATQASARAVEPPPDRPEYSRQGLDDQKQAFARRAGGGKAYVEDVLHQPLSPLMIRRGRIIPAVLTNAPSTDMPGDVFAMVSVDIYDSLTGRCKLIPAGTIISGEMNSTVAYGEDVAQAAWTGMSIEGTGQWIDLGSMPFTNSEGRAGMHGKVDRHRDTFALALLGSLTVKMLGIAPELMSSGGNEVTVYGAGGNAAASTAADPLNEIVTRELNRENTIYGDIGDPAPFLANRDLYLPAQGDCDA